jgi:hypothetical protein
MKKIMERVLLGVSILLVPASGFACSMGQWDSNTGVTAIVGSPQTSPAVPRFSESCGLQVTAPTVGYVQDNSPDGHTTFIARFYVRPNLTGSGQADLFAAYGDEAGGLQRLKVSYDGTNLDFHADEGVAGTALAAANNWHLVEIEYNSAGTTRFWVNKDATSEAESGSFSSATGAVSSVRLGVLATPTNLTGAPQFDAYESHSTTPVGALLLGDANGGGTLTSGDALRVLGEIAIGGTLSPGQPDCNRNGSITSGDALCILGLLAIP